MTRRYRDVYRSLARRGDGGEEADRVQASSTTGRTT
jgi:hypothetical protein